MRTETGTDLKPCDCGGPPRQHLVTVCLEPDQNDAHYFVSCGACGARTGYHDSPAAAEAAWNSGKRRAVDRAE